MNYILLSLCLFASNLCYALSDEDRRFVDAELAEIRSAPQQAYVRVLRIASKGEDAVYYALPTFSDVAATVIASGDTHFVQELLSAIGRFDKQTISQEQYTNLEKLVVNGNENLKSTLRRVKEKIKLEEPK